MASIFSINTYSDEEKGGFIETSISTLSAHLALLQKSSISEKIITIDPGEKSIQLGDDNPRVNQLRARLIQMGYQLAEKGSFDVPLENAVKDYQKSINVDVDGKVGSLTLFNLNLTREDKINIIQNQLSAMNEIANTHGLNKFILVNIPAYKLYAYQNGYSVIESKVVLGRKDRQTPLMDTSMTRIIYNPTWSPPPTIIKKDIFKNGKINPKYIADHELMLVDAQNNPVELDENVSLNDFLSYRIKLVQPASNKNALGLIKFQLNNTPDIYIHDTNQHGLFSLTNRALSSGCIRVEKYLDLASWALSLPKGRITKKIQAALTSTERVENIPVKTVYWMAEAVKGDTVLFYPDIYNLKSNFSLAATINKPLY